MASSIVHQQQIASGYPEEMVKSMDVGTDAEDVAELPALYKRNDWMCSEVGQGVKVFV